MKALIPVAGVGTRLRPHTYTQPKPLIPVAGKPIISFIIDHLVDAGVTEFVFVIGYLGEKIRNYVEERYPKLSKSFVYQNERKGLGHAVWTAKKKIEDADEVFIVLGDTIFDANIRKMIAAPTSCLGVKQVQNPRDFGVAEYNEDTLEVSRVVEKPRIPMSNKALVGLYKIKEVNALIDAIQYNIDNDIRTLGEYQLTDAIMRMISLGISFKAFPINNWFDCGKKEILLETNAILLKKNGKTTEIQSKYDNSIIIPPVSIGSNCTIKNSIIGPYVTIGDSANIISSIVKNSIIGEFSAIEGVVLHHSVVGSDAAIKGLSQSLNIGDNTEIDFS